MARLIDADDAKVIIEERYDTAFMQSRTRPNIAWWEGYSAGVNWARNTINDAPTVDAVPVVRCKDCKHKEIIYGDGGKMANICVYGFGLKGLICEDDFCSYGKRRTDEE